MLEMVYDPTTTTALKIINLLHDLVISYVKLIIKCSWVLIDLNTSERNVTDGSVLAQGLVDLQNSCLVIDTI